ncbi:hypothetical protein TRVA0_008S02410 [Trichomonascus vanleenenianus]|uniref:Aim34p n=1 Tax=Trichomonascus vanleenenianus TaxID=2268995 RepID=UPI003ECAEA54
MNTSTRAMRTLRAVKSAPNLKRGIKNSAPSPNPSHLLSTPSQYTSLSVASLKAECRRNGLKVSGRKAELIDRLAAFEASRSMQSSSFASAFSTTKPKFETVRQAVDRIRLPLAGRTPDEPIKYKIPVPPDAYSTTAKDASTKYSHDVPDHGAAGSAGRQSGTEQLESEVHITGDADVRSLAAETLVTRLSEKEEQEYYEEKKFHPGELTSSDKTFLAGFAAVITGWWLLGSGKDKKDKKSGH